MKLTRFFTLLLSCGALFVACDEKEPEAKPTVTVLLSVDKQSVMVGDSVTFTVTKEDGTDVTADAKFIDKSNDFAVVSNPYVIPYDGEIEVYALYDDINQSNSVTIEATLGHPTLAEDANPAKLNFSHRMLLVDHTGSKCSFCPKMMNVLKEVEETEGYHEKYYEVMSHSYSTRISDDLAYSPAAGIISSYFGINQYPTLTYNFDASKKSTYNDDIKSNIDSYWGAMTGDAGIAAITLVGRNAVNIEAAVKVKSAGDYRLTAWLLEDGIYQVQAGNTAEWQDTHNNVVRAILTNDPLTGEELGTLEAGATVKKSISFSSINRKWVPANFKVLFIVSKKGDNGRYDVANVALCPGNESIDYAYLD